MRQAREELELPHRLLQVGEGNDLFLQARTDLEELAESLLDMVHEALVDFGGRCVSEGDHGLRVDDDGTDFEGNQPLDCFSVCEEIENRQMFSESYFQQ